MSNIYKLSNGSVNNGQNYNDNNNINENNNSNDTSIDDQYKYEDIGKKIFDTTAPSNGTLSFFNLGIVHVDYVEMKRERDQIGIKGTKAIGEVKALYRAMEELAGLVDYSLNTSNCENSISSIEKEFSYIKEEMTKQIDLYTSQTELTKAEIAQLNNIVITIINNPNLSYNNKSGEYSIQYNEALKKYKQEALMSGYGIVSIDYLLDNCKTSNQIVNIYDYIETNLQKEMKEVGVSSGKEYLNLILDSASENATSNREKAVCRALALNKFLGEHGIAGKYAKQVDGQYVPNGHGTYLLDDISTGTDCSSYASILAKQGNPNFEAGATGTLYYSKNTTALDINDILPGDIIVSHGNPSYEHARFVLAVDKENNRIITTECGGYLGSGGYDDYTWDRSKTHVDSFDVDTLIRQGYRTNHVDYGDEDTSEAITL